MGNIKDLTLQLEGNDKIISFLADNLEILNKVSRFQVAVEKLSANQKKLKDLNSKLSKDTTDAEKDKNSRREELVAVTISVILIMQVFAHDKKKGKLQRKLYHLNHEYIQNCLDLELIEISKEIWLIANKFGGYALTFVSKIKAALDPDNVKATNKFEKDFGLNPEMIKNLEDSILNFIKAMLPYNGEMAEKEKAAIKMKEINKKTKKLLTNKIDRYVILLVSENSDFYNEYHQLRGNQFQKQVKESLEHESDPINILVEDVPTNLVKPIARLKPPKKLNPLKK